jgi:hypothetical protein
LRCCEVATRPYGAGLPVGTLEPMLRLTWSKVNPASQWIVEGLEKDLLDSNETPEELMVEAARLRAQAAETDIKAYREADLMAAANFELVAAERLAAAETA